MPHVTILDMQPIDPPTGGGRLRLLGLYHNLDQGLPATYIGTYDWPGPGYRRHKLSPTLEEIDIPLSKAHFELQEEWKAKVGGKTIIDVAFPYMAHLSPTYVEAAVQATKKADIVVFSHPWIYPVVRNYIDQKHQLVVYDSHNCEGLLRCELLDDGKFGTQLVHKVVELEYELCHCADLILACSHEDRISFNRFYNVPFKKMLVVPNGVFVTRIPPGDPDIRERTKQKLGLKGKVAIFLGSQYQPNVEAALFICEHLAPALSNITFLICGSVSNTINSHYLQKMGIKNVRVTGFVTEEEKLLYLHASDIAINPMFSGSGTNIKMFEFMATGLPVVTTEIGARGIVNPELDAFKVCSKENFPHAILEILNNQNMWEKYSCGARRLVTENYSWERISPFLGKVLLRNLKGKRKGRPYFSVIIPTYERHNHLSKLIKRLEGQRYKDFEVIIVDQSKNRWEPPDMAEQLHIYYYHTDIKGAAKARNIGLTLALGDVIAFTDDDCEPYPDWLENAGKYFKKQDVIGIEGLIKSDSISDSLRCVSNEGFEGIGFMTANLFVLREMANRVNGFDEAFDNPHFREDTDFAWRLLSYGKIPYASNVRVYHPPHPRNIERESLTERVKFFEKDALLAKKHPELFIILFKKEAHYIKTPGYWENFLRGCLKYNCTWVLENLELHGINWKDYAQKKKELKFSSRKIKAKGNAFLQQDYLKKNEELFKDLLKLSAVNLPLVIPKDVNIFMESALSLVQKVEQIVGNKGHGDYFSASKKRYAHYFAAAMNLKKGSTVLDLGNAPGHVGIGLHLLGMKVHGVNLNEHWRETYPSPDWIDTLNVIEVDVEHQNLPFEDGSFDAALFTEVLEHVAITDPIRIMEEIKRVLKPDGMLIFSTPNVCNISNIYALTQGINIFWSPEIFYGGLDRHNREYTPSEVLVLFNKAGFKNIVMYGFNCDSNWRKGTADFIHNLISEIGDEHPLLRNTIMVLARR